jgi:hypothetical protein
MTATPAPTAAPAPAASSSGDRLLSLDQFRGYTVAGMFLVNYIGSFAAIGAFLPTLKHFHTHCSYADTIMPQFLLAVGFGFRMSYLKRREHQGMAQANWRVVRRILGLLLVAFFVHQLDGNYRTWEDLKALGIGGFFTQSFQRQYFQTLGHIGVTSLWVIPVIGAGAAVRLVYMVLSGLLFVYLSNSWYYEWEMTRPGVDGGPLGFLTWTSPLILGTFAYDIWKAGVKMPVLRIFGIGCVSMLIAYALSCLNTFTFPNQLPADATFRDRLAENPFVRPIEPKDPSAPVRESYSFWKALTVSGPDIPPTDGPALVHWVPPRNEAYQKAIESGQLAPGSSKDQLPMETWHDPSKRYLNQWTMSQRAGSLSYTLFGGGFGMCLLALMMIVCDRWGVQIGLFRTLGVNALIGYILHDMVNSAVKPFVPNDAPMWWVFAGFGLSLGICYLVLRTIEKQKIFFRL